MMTSRGFNGYQRRDFGDVQEGDKVRILVTVMDEDLGIQCGKPGDYGTVLDTIDGCLPTVQFHTSGAVFGLTPEEFEIVSRRVADNDGQEVTVRVRYVTCRACDGSGRSGREVCGTCRGFLQELVRV